MEFISITGFVSHVYPVVLHYMSWILYSSWFFAPLFCSCWSLFFGRFLGHMRVQWVVHVTQCWMLVWGLFTLYCVMHNEVVGVLCFFDNVVVDNSCVFSLFFIGIYKKTRLTYPMQCNFIQLNKFHTSRPRLGIWSDLISPLFGDSVGASGVKGTAWVPRSAFPKPTSINSGGSSSFTETDAAAPDQSTFGDMLEKNPGTDNVFKKHINHYVPISELEDNFRTYEQTSLSSSPQTNPNKEAFTGANGPESFASQKGFAHRGKVMLGGAIGTAIAVEEGYRIFLKASVEVGPDGHETVVKTKVDEAADNFRFEAEKSFAKAFGTQDDVEAVENRQSTHNHKKILKKNENYAAIKSEAAEISKKTNSSLFLGFTSAEIFDSISWLEVLVYYLLAIIFLFVVLLLWSYINQHFLFQKIEDYMSFVDSSGKVNVCSPIVNRMAPFVDYTESVRKKVGWFFLIIYVLRGIGYTVLSIKIFNLLILIPVSFFIFRIFYDIFLLFDLFRVLPSRVDICLKKDPGLVLYLQDKTYFTQNTFKIFIVLFCIINRLFWFFLIRIPTLFLPLQVSLWLLGLVQAPWAALLLDWF